MKIYLAGPMKGHPQFNFPAFHHHAKKLRDEGHVVFSPAEHDIKKHGPDFGKDNLTGDPTSATKQNGFNLREALAADMEYICLHADAVAVMPGWEKSKGANAEKATAEALGLQIIILED